MGDVPDELDEPTWALEAAVGETLLDRVERHIVLDFLVHPAPDVDVRQFAPDAVVLRRSVVADHGNGADLHDGDQADSQRVLD